MKRLESLYWFFTSTAIKHTTSKVKTPLQQELRILFNRPTTHAVISFVILVLRANTEAGTGQWSRMQHPV